MNKRISRFVAIFIAVGMVTVLMLSLTFFQEFEFEKPEPIMVRQISLSTPPPPPPPPSTQQTQTESTPSINLSADGAGPAMEFTEVKLPSETQIAELAPPEMNNMSTNFLDNLSVDWQAFGLDELDDVPRLLTNLKIKYPPSLVRKGVRSIEVELDVLIDEDGKVILRRIVRNPHPEFEPIILKLMKHARFTAPKKNGISVRAAFNWPLEFSHT